MAKIITQLDLPTKHVMGAPLKVVNIIDSNSTRDYDDEEMENLDEKILFFSNQLGDSHPTYYMQGGNKG